MTRMPDVGGYATPISWLYINKSVPISESRLFRYRTFESELERDGIPKQAIWYTTGRQLANRLQRCPERLNASTCWCRCGWECFASQHASTCTKASYYPWSSVCVASTPDKPKPRYPSLITLSPITMNFSHYQVPLLPLPSLHLKARSKNQKARWIKSARERMLSKQTCLSRLQSGTAMLQT